MKIRLVRPITVQHFNKKTGQWERVTYPPGTEMKFIREDKLDPRRIESRTPFVVRHGTGNTYRLGKGVFEYV